MTNHHKPSYGTSGPDKSGHQGSTPPAGIDLKRDRADKARVGGQHSHGGTPRRSDG